MDNSAVSRKDLEANGHVEDTPSEGSSDQLNPYQKRSRRMEYAYISIAVVLGAALIAVLVYYTVTNAQKDDPVAVSNTDSISTTSDYDDLFGNIGGGGDDDDDDNFGGLLPSDMTRGSSNMGNMGNTGNTGQATTTESTASTTTKAPTGPALRTFRMVGGHNPNTAAGDSGESDVGGDAQGSNNGGDTEGDDQGSNDGGESDAGGDAQGSNNGEDGTGGSDQETNNAGIDAEEGNSGN